MAKVQLSAYTHVGTLTHSVDMDDESCRSLMQQLLSMHEGEDMLLFVSSFGGYIGVSIALADLIRQRNVTTVAVGAVASAAVLVFCSGRQRLMMPGSALHFHDPYIGSRPDTLFELVRDKATTSEQHRRRTRLREASHSKHLKLASKLKGGTELAGLNTRSYCATVAEALRTTAEDIERCCNMDGAVQAADLVELGGVEWYDTTPQF
jgi:ATP-dependent protease ClpP protease subunit